MNAKWVSAAWKKIPEMVVDPSLKKCSIIYALDVTEKNVI